MWKWWPLTLVLLMLASFALIVTGLLLWNDGLGPIAVAGFFCIAFFGWLDSRMFEGKGADAIFCVKDSKSTDKTRGEVGISATAAVEYRLPALVVAKV